MEMRWPLVVLLSAVAEASIRHACQSDADCGKFGSASYAYECCTTVVCNAAFAYFLVSSGCVAVPNPMRKCAKLAKASNTGRFAAQLRIEDWRSVQGRVGQNCDAARREVSGVLGVAPPPGPQSQRDNRFLPAGGIPLKKNELGPPPGADVFSRRRTWSRSSWRRTTTTPAPYANVKSLDGRCERGNPLRSSCDRRGQPCCIAISCIDPRRVGFRRRRIQLNYRESCANDCRLNMVETRDAARSRIYQFTFPADSWFRNWYTYLDENFQVSPLKDCSELRYYYWYLENN